MRSILIDITQVEGVNGSLVFSDGGKLLEQVMSPDVDQKAPPPAVGEAVARIVAAANANGQSDIGDIDLVYDGGRLILKPLGSEGCFCILCVRRVNVALLNVTANLAARKLQQMISEMRAAGMELVASKTEREIDRPPTETMTRAEMLAMMGRKAPGGTA
jgi:predicted regulator of Ras-like GTPase activity (Roadblock/LC7/MglB family)